MKFKKDILGFINYKQIILLLLLAYIIWLITVFYTTITGIDEMYNDSYNKRVDEKNKITEIIRLKNNQTDAEYETYDEFKVSIDSIINKK
ncbi:MAG: hypothetical protein Q8K30_05630 [Candidatus Gracilibacteria bacterium]|nr:hypothetical protein [Candidatus Gracilibacteria bacterium]MDP3381626.1 hypothetical protein [bacterium]